MNENNNTIQGIQGMTYYTYTQPRTFAPAVVNATYVGDQMKHKLRSRIQRRTRTCNGRKSHHHKSHGAVQILLLLIIPVLCPIAVLLEFWQALKDVCSSIARATH